MIKTGAAKKLIIVLLSIMLSVLALFSVLTIVAKQKPLPEQTSSANYFTFGTGKLTGLFIMDSFGDNEYNAYTDFHINSAYGLMWFSEAVSDGYDFAGKNVYLDCDIDWKEYYKDCAKAYENYAVQVAEVYGVDSKVYKAVIERIEDVNQVYLNAEKESWQPAGADMSGTTYHYMTEYEVLAGVFDGQNHTIKNLSCVIELYDKPDIDEALDYLNLLSPHLGFFVALSGNAVVKNLALYKFYISAANYKYLGQEYGGVIGAIASISLQYNSSSQQKRIIL